MEEMGMTDLQFKSFLKLLIKQLENAKTEEECEKQLSQLFKSEKHLWHKLHHLILLFGRYNCKAIKPECGNCILKDYCKHYNKKG